jgi:3',5'-cyclic-AMP phosphodiesterase
LQADQTRVKRMAVYGLFLRSICLLLVVAGCDIFEYHPYEVRVPDDEQRLNATAIARIQANTPPGDTLTIILMGDTQRFYDEVEDFVASANQRAADFVLLDGDITDFGVNDEFAWIHDLMKRLNKPYLAVIGNHDLSGNGGRVFKKRYGPLNTSFIVNRFKFLLFNTNSREYQYNGHVPDLPWLREQLLGDDFDRVIPVSHVPPFDVDFDSALEPDYVQALRESPKVNVSLHGHRHAYSNAEHYGDGVRYIVSTSMNERMYLVIKLWGDQYRVEEIYY